uniref:DEAD/DEAH box helicase n=1 Tax=Klebsiella pneumoniae TaxID=573 RepID=UPI000AFB46F2
MTTYAEFLARKTALVEQPGSEVSLADMHPMLHPWQKDLVRWAVRTGRAALWADTGMGKTVMQLEWARLSGDRPLIVAPLAVCAQTVREANKLDVTAEYIAEPDPDMFRRAQIIVTNYERLHNFIPDMFDAVVLDESSILKQSDGKTRTMLIEWASGIPHRLACSATPAPNDPEELTNQAEWLGRMSRTHMLAAYFIHDSDGWRLKGHARKPMIEWMAQWAVALTKPSDVGGDDTGYILPGVEVI